MKYKYLTEIDKSREAISLIKNEKDYKLNNYNNNEIYWIPQGGAMKEAKIGIEELCEEIVNNIKKIDNDISEKWKVNNYYYTEYYHNLYNN